MVNTLILSGVALATLINMVFVAASENPRNSDISGLTTNDTGLVTMPDEDYDLDYGSDNYEYDYGSSIEERKRRCPGDKKCSNAGGSCIRSRAHCDGTVDFQKCKGRKCKCCIPGQSTTACPACPTVPQCPTCLPCSTMYTTTTQIPTTTAVPGGFEIFNGRVIRRTNTSDAKSNYTLGMAFCNQFGAKPFIPRTSADYDLYRDVRNALGSAGWMWIPADDRKTEGTLRWSNGDIVGSNIALLDWRNNQTLIYNRDAWDCVFYGWSGSRADVHMWICDRNDYPPICEII